MQRTKPPFRADEVGSLLRPQRIKEARAKFEKGEIGADELRKAEDIEIEKVVHRQASTGLEARDRRRVSPVVVAFRFPCQADRLRAVSSRDRHSVRGRRDTP